VTSASLPEASSNAETVSDRALGVPGSPDALRHVMGHFASGVTIATALYHGIKHAMTATAVCSVSLEPPLVLVCVSKSSRFHGAITKAK
jgi:flavin reductase